MRKNEREGRRRKDTEEDEIRKRRKRINIEEKEVLIKGQGISHPPP